MFSEWVFIEQTPLTWMEVFEMTTPDRMQGQIEVMNQRINSLSDGLLEVGKIGTMAREAMATDSKQSLQRIHERIDDVFKEIRGLAELKTVIHGVETRVAHLEKIVWFALTSGIAGLCAALWQFIGKH